jgi:hypothetical protein
VRAQRAVCRPCEPTRHPARVAAAARGHTPPRARAHTRPPSCDRSWMTAA